MIEAENFSDHSRTGSLSIKEGVELITIRTRLGIYGTRGKRSCLRHCVTSRKVEGSIPDSVDSVSRIFH